MRQIEIFIDQVEEAIAGNLDNSQERELKNSIYRTYAYNNNTGFIARAVNNDGWKQVLATLRDYRDRLDHELAVAQVLTTRFGGRHSTMRRLGVYDVPMGIPRMGDRKEGARRPLSSCRRYPIPPILFLIDSSPSMCMTCDL